MHGLSSSWRVTSRANNARSTANAPPAATAWRFAAAISGELRLQEPRRAVGLGALERVGADELGRVPRMVHGGRMRGAHLDKAHGDSARGEVQGRLAARQSDRQLFHMPGNMMPHILGHVRTFQKP